MGDVPLPAHESPLPEVPVPLTDRGHEDVLVVGVPDRRLKGKAVDAVVSFFSKSFVIFPVHPNSMEN